MRIREERLRVEPKFEEFLSDLAVRRKVAASTQNQAFKTQRTCPRR